MSPSTFTRHTPDAVRSAEHRLWVGLGEQIRSARLDRRWSIGALAARAGVSRSLVYLVEAGGSASTEAALRLTGALGLRLDFAVSDPRRGASTAWRASAVSPPVGYDHRSEIGGLPGCSSGSR